MQTSSFPGCELQSTAHPLVTWVCRLSVVQPDEWEMWIMVGLVVLVALVVVALVVWVALPSPVVAPMFTFTSVVTRDGVVNVWWSEGSPMVFYQARIRGRWGAVGMVECGPREYPVQRVYALSV